MNIFFLDMCPKVSATYYLNKHCIKIIVEITQMLYAAHHICPCTPDWEKQHTIGTGLASYRKTHVHHPTSKWVRETSANYNYTVAMGLALCAEYTLRFHRQHACELRLMWLRDNPIVGEDCSIQHHRAVFNVPDGCTPIPLAMPREYYSDDAVFSYRLYYLIEKSKMITPRDTVSAKTLISSFDMVDYVDLVTSKM